jgi:hypothetical protein
MKKLFFALLVALAFAGCSTPTGSTASSKPVAYVYNSAWENVPLEDLALKVVSKSLSSDTITAKDVSTDITLEDVEDAVAVYNDAVTDDQLFVETEEMPIEESPNVNAYIILSTTHKVVETFLDRPRTGFVTDKRLWDSQLDYDTAVQGIQCLLYVDQTPPDEIVYVPPEPKLWVALLDTTAKVVYYSEHYDTEAEALYRYRFGMLPQAEQYNLYDRDDGIDVPGDVWRAYIGTVEATTDNAF